VNEGAPLRAPAIRKAAAMQRKSTGWKLAAACACAFAMACGGGFEVDESITPLAKATGWRDALLGQQAYAIVEIAYDRETAEQAWAENAPPESVSSSSSVGPGIFGEVDDVDFERQVLVVWSSGEGGCPAWLANVTTRTDENGTHVHLEVGIKEPRFAVCDASFRHYQMILAIERERLPAPEHLPTESVSGIPDGIVAAYPL
jgi:hypothetical protein